MSKPKLIFAGTPDFAVPTLEALIAANYDIVAVYTQPDRPAGRGQKLTASPVKKLALQHHLTVEQPQSLKTSDTCEQLSHHDADAMIVIAYGLILPQTILNLFASGCINVHASLLPRWRGAAPIQRAILAGDKTTGISIMQMQAGLDTGPVFVKVPCEIAENTTAKKLHDELAQLGAKTLIDVLPDILMQSLTPQPQDERLATYAKKLEKSEAEINWQNSAIGIQRCIKAFNPWPVAFTHLNADTVRIWDSEIVSIASTQAPGTIISAEKPGIFVATGAGVINILQLQFPGGKVLSAQEILNSKEEILQPGNKFE